jgi:hypothetical protein
MTSMMMMNLNDKNNSKQAMMMAVVVLDRGDRVDEIRKLVTWEGERFAGWCRARRPKTRE